MKIQVTPVLDQQTLIAWSLSAAGNLVLVLKDGAKEIRAEMSYADADALSKMGIVAGVQVAHATAQARAAQPVLVGLDGLPVKS
jgi:hypothetical protein